MKNLPFISVIVTAYDRKDFLLDALKSVINQSLPRDRYEILCIKNFADTKIDAYIKTNNILDIRSSGTVGYFLHTSIKSAKGDIIVFLDDDDLFSRNKLERVYNVFLDGTIDFYHNNSIRGAKPDSLHGVALNSDDYKIITPPYRFWFNNTITQATFNMSSIALKKQILTRHLNEIKQAITNPDVLMLLFAIIENSHIFFDRNILTLYRFHSKNTSFNSEIGDRAKYIRSKSIPSLYFQLKLASRHKSVKAYHLVKAFLLREHIYLDILQNSPKTVLFRDVLHSMSLFDAVTIKTLKFAIYYIFNRDKAFHMVAFPKPN